MFECYVDGGIVVFMLLCGYCVVYDVFFVLG